VGSRKNAPGFHSRRQWSNSGSFRRRPSGAGPEPGSATSSQEQKHSRVGVMTPTYGTRALLSSRNRRGFLSRVFCEEVGLLSCPWWRKGDVAGGSWLLKQGSASRGLGLRRGCSQLTSWRRLQLPWATRCPQHARAYRIRWTCLDLVIPRLYLRFI
jgi:hypothetical protein